MDGAASTEQLKTVACIVEAVLPLFLEAELLCVENVSK